MSIEFNTETNIWEGVPNKTTFGSSFTVLVLDNGRKILSFGDELMAGAQVHVLDENNREVAVWDCVEWEIEGEGEVVMGAMLLAAAGKNAR